MSIKKHYLKNIEICMIISCLKDKVKSIDNVRIAGDFNDCDLYCEPMKALKKGGLTQSLDRSLGKSYQFKYLINDAIWTYNPESDEFVPNGTVPV